VYLYEVISTRRFCGSRAPGAVGTRLSLSPRPLTVMSPGATPETGKGLGDIIGSPLRETLVIARRPGPVSVTCDLQMHPAACFIDVGRLLDDLQTLACDGVLVPVEENQEHFGRWWRHWGRRRGRRRPAPTVCLLRLPCSSPNGLRFVGAPRCWLPAVRRRCGRRGSWRRRPPAPRGRGTHARSRRVSRTQSVPPARAWLTPTRSGSIRPSLAIISSRIEVI
jgi:hypothetical protein